MQNVTILAEVIKSGRAAKKPSYSNFVKFKMFITYKVQKVQEIIKKFLRSSIVKLCRSSEAHSIFASLWPISSILSENRRLQRTFNNLS